MTTRIISADEAASRSRHPTARAVVRPVPARFYLLFAITVVLSLTGLLMVLSASSVKALHDADLGSPWFYFNRQALWLAIGFVAFFVCLKIDYRRWRPLIPLLLLVTIVLLLAVLRVGVTVNGAKAWLDLGGPFRIQPSELLKLALLLYSADLLARRGDRMAEPRWTMVPVLIMLALTGGLVMAQSDLGTALVIAGIVMCVLYFAGAPIVPFTAVAALIGTAGVGFMLSSPYRRNRWLTFLNPWDDPLNTGLQSVQAMYAIASGGITGVGVGASRAKWGFLPEAHTDFIFAIIAEELGLVGCLMIVVLLGCFAVLGVKAAVSAPDRYGMLLAGGVTAWVMLQAIVNLGGVVGLLPITGLPLPFVSFGGASLIVLLGSTGMLLNVARQGKMPVLPAEPYGGFPRDRDGAAPARARSARAARRALRRKYRARRQP